jgi:hypothetical protein
MHIYIYIYIYNFLLVCSRGSRKMCMSFLEGRQVAGFRLFVAVTWFSSVVLSALLSALQ